MKMEELHRIARARGVTPDNLFKIELIKTIQLAEGNFDCFASAKQGECDQFACFWRTDCLVTASQQ